MWVTDQDWVTVRAFPFPWEVISPQEQPARLLGRCCPDRPLPAHLGMPGVQAPTRRHRPKTGVRDGPWPSFPRHLSAGSRDATPLTLTLTLRHLSPIR